MTFEFDFQKHERLHLRGSLPDGGADNTNQFTGAIDMLKRDRFELLSAYLDGEVTAEERRQVEDWLANDPITQRLYARLLKLRQGLRKLPVPPVEQPVEQRVDRVLTRLNHKPRVAAFGGGAAIAALLVGALSSLLQTHQSIAPQVAQSPALETQPAPLMLALNGPPVEIPKAPSASKKSLKQVVYP
jgi:anti-sigma factor RsiW